MDKELLKIKALQQFIRELTYHNNREEEDLINYKNQMTLLKENIQQRKDYIKYLKSQLLDISKIVFISMTCRNRELSPLILPINFIIGINGNHSECWYEDQTCIGNKK